MYKIEGKLQIELPTERHSKLGRLWEKLFIALCSIERAYLEQGPERSVYYTRDVAKECVKLCCDGMRESYRILASHDPELRLDLQQNLELTLIPTPLTILYVELAELQNDRPSRLLSNHRPHGASESAHNLLRRFATTKAVATVDVLRTTGLSLNEAAERVAKTLNTAKFPNPRGRPYASGTIKDWCKRRKKKKGDFNKLIDQSQRELKDLLEDCREMELDDEKMRAVILQRLYSFIQAISYGYE